MELSVIEASTSIIALDIYKRISMLETESKHKIEFFEDLFSGGMKIDIKRLWREPIILILILIKDTQ